MALTLSLKAFDAPSQTHSARPTPRNNVIPFPSPRVLLPVILSVESENRTRAQLATLLRSPLGVYVTSTEVVRSEIRVQLDIAREDLDFTIHTLMTTLCEAMIGPLKRRRAN
jgi:hypothetical protein